jgi:hypothetical protein
LPAASADAALRRAAQKLYQDLVEDGIVKA